MSDDTPEEAIERGLDAYFAGDTITDLLDGIDVDALADGASLDDAVAYEQLGKALGAVVGRAAVRGVSTTGLLGRVVRESVGSEVGGRVGKAAVATLVEYGDSEELVGAVRRTLDPERLDQLADDLPESGVAHIEDDPASESDWTEIEVEDAK